MNFIPQWGSFQNEVCTAFTRHNWWAQVFAPAQKSSLLTISLRHFEGHACTTCPRLHSLLFSFQNEVCFQFTWSQSEISYQNGNFIWIENWNELISEWLIMKWNFDSVWCKQTQRNMWPWKAKRTLTENRPNGKNARMRKAYRTLRKHFERFGWPFSRTDELIIRTVWLTIQTDYRTNW